MHISFSRAFVAIHLIFIAACTPVSKMPTIENALAQIEADKQREMIVRQQINDVERVHTIAYGILAANVDICKSKNFEINKGSGLYLANKHSFASNLHSVAQAKFDFDETVSVLSVAKDSPAAQAGVMKNDILVSISDWSVPVGKNAVDKTIKKLLGLAKSASSIKLTVVSNGNTKQLTLKLEEKCGFGYSLSSDDQVNAFADGENITIMSGMMRFIENDTELATIIGHEIAHNLMSHSDKSQGNAGVGLVFDLLAAGFGINTQGAFSNIGAQAYSQDFESEADYVGLYLMAKSGWKVDETPYFWRRMGMRFPSNIKGSHSSSHPSTPQRFVMLEKTAAEINKKLKAGADLVPEVIETK